MTSCLPFLSTFHPFSPAGFSVWIRVTDSCININVIPEEYSFPLAWTLLITLGQSKESAVYRLAAQTLVQTVFFSSCIQDLSSCTFRNWSSIQVRKKRKKNLNYMWSFASRSQLINCFPFCLYQNCKEIRSHSGADSVFWSCGSFKVFHHQFSTIYFGRRQWKKLIRKMCVHATEGTR